LDFGGKSRGRMMMTITVLGFRLGFFWLEEEEEEEER
jgi:hypothetical protein